MLYAFFWVITRRLEFICRRFGTLFHFHRQVYVSRNSTHIYLSMKMEQCVPKRRHINSRRPIITQKKAYKKLICFLRSRAGCQPETDESFRNSGKHYHFLFCRMNGTDVTFIASQIRFDIQLGLKREISFERETLKHLK